LAKTILEVGLPIDTPVLSTSKELKVIAVAVLIVVV
jgi:hypothetical protein